MKRQRPLNYENLSAPAWLDAPLVGAERYVW